MLLAFSAGIALAVGHHFFYQSLAGTPATAASYDVFGFETSKQQLSIALGTSFALGAKTCFMIAASTVYVQAFWREASKSGAKQMTLAQIDAAYGVLSNLTGLFAISVWARHPILLFIAIVSW
jgi:hypothetical protein